MKFRISKHSDKDRIMELIQQAKCHLKRLGVNQWQDGYPDLNIIIEDIESGDGYVMTDGDTIIGYVCVSFEQEECYANIKGKWKSEQPYAVIHRMVVDDKYKGKGLATEFFSFSEKLCISKKIHSIKVDTDKDNLAMQHILSKNGYEYCGIVWFQNSDKTAFEKLI